MALIIPPAIFAVHIQFNLLYQFWIHTEVNIGMHTMKHLRSVLLRVGAGLWRGLCDGFFLRVNVMTMVRQQNVPGGVTET